MITKRPNLVFIFPDQYRPFSMGFLGQEPVLTPNLDRLASESLVLTQAVSNYPLCSPYRAMLFTGTYPFTNGVTNNCYSRTIPYDVELKPTARCLSDVLHDRGYDLGYLGKWHLDLPRGECSPFADGRQVSPDAPGEVWDAYTPPGPRRHGFNFWHSYGTHGRHLSPHYWVGDAPVGERLQVNGWSVEHETDVAVDFIRDHPRRPEGEQQPFALFVAFNPPHTPFEQVPPRYREYYRDRRPEELLVRPNVAPREECETAWRHVQDYFAAVTGIDEQVGRILRALDEAGQADDTIVVFTADHGEMLGSHGLMHKNVWYDESLLVPFLMRWPGRIAPRRDDLLLSVPDLMPSLLTLMGCAEDIPTEVEGVDYSAALRGLAGARPRSALYMQVRPAAPLRGRRGVRTHDHTFVIEWQEDGRETVILHDNREDPYQLANVADANPDVVRALREELAGWLARTNDPLAASAAREAR